MSNFYSLYRNFFSILIKYPWHLWLSLKTILKINSISYPSLSLNPSSNYNTDPELEDQAGSSARPITQVSDDDKQTLIQQARDLKKFFDDFETEFTQGNHTAFYIVSTKWLNQWKKYVSYDEIIAGNEPNLNSFGQVNPGPVNEDIIDNDPRFVLFSGYPDDKSFTNVLLRDGIQEGRDYQLITEAAWESITKDYEGFAVKRPCKKLANGQTQVEVRLKKVLRKFCLSILINRV